MLLVVAIITVVGADLVFRRLSPPKYVREVVDAMEEYEHEDPTTLVLGSSHARTFAVMDKIVRERTNGQERIMAVPLEWGKFRSYEWLLHHRIEPLIDEKDSSGNKKRPSLRRFIFVMAWWDACWVDGDPPVFNLPSRAWTFKDFAADVLDKGINDHNRNYVTSRFGGLFHGSILVSDRGHNALITALHDKVKPLSAEAKQAQFEDHLEGWRSIMERGKICLGHKGEMEAADRIVEWGKGRGLDTTVMLYPMMPITMTEDTIEHVQKPFEAMMAEFAKKHNVRFIDATFDNGGLTDQNFQPDFDHLTPTTHVSFSEWLLADQLKFLVEPPNSAHASAPSPAPDAPAASTGGAP